MSDFKHSRTGRVVAIATGFLTAVLMLGGAAVLPAHAQSVEDLQKQIAELQAMIAKLSGGSSMSSAGASASMSYTFSRNLKQGDSGPDVMALQKILNSNPATQVAMSGAGSPGMESSHFGPATKRAVVKFQEWKADDILTPVGLSKGTGVVGPSTRAALNAWASPAPVVVTPPSSGTTPPPSGTTPPSSGTTPPGAVTPPVVTLPAGAGLSVERLNKDVTFIAIPTNSSSMSFGQFKFTAGTSEVRVTGLHLRRTGLGSKNDFQDVWVVANGVMHGSERSVTSGDVADFSFSSDPIVIPAGGSATVELMGSMSSTAAAGSYNTLGITLVDANVPVNATLPLDGPQTTTASQSVASVTLTTQGSSKNVPVGSLQTEIGRFRLDVSSSNDQDVKIKSITFRNQGTAKTLAKTLANAAIRVAGNIISSKVDINDANKTITFQLGDSGYFMKNGQSQSFEVIADLVAAEVNDTIILQLNRAFNLVGVEAGTGVGVRVKGDDGTTATDPASNVSLKTYTMLTGKINFTSGNNSSRSIAKGIADVTFVDGKITVGAAFRADGIKARLASGTSISGSTRALLQADYNKANLLIDGISVKSVDTLTAGTGGVLGTGSTGDYYNFNSKFEVAAGEHTLQVRVNVQTGATANDALKLQVFSGDLDTARYIKTGDNTPATEISGSILGSLITIKSATLTATRNDGFAGETIVGGIQGVKMFKFTLDANDSSDIHVTGMTFARTTGSTYAAADVTNMRLFVAGKEVANPTDLSNGSFSNVDFTILKSQQAQVEVMVNTNTVSSALTLGLDLQTINAFDSQGNSATVNHSNGTALASTNALQSATFTISTGGSFTMTLSGDSPKEDILIGDNGAAWYPVASYRLTAKDDQIKVTDLYFGNATSTTNVIATSTFADARIKSLGVFDKNGVLKSEKAPSLGTVHFDFGKNFSETGFGAISVPKNDSAVIWIKAKLNDIKDANKTGALLRLVLDPTAGTGSTGVTVQSVATGADIASSSIIAARNNDGLSPVGSLRATTTATDFFALRRTKPALSAVQQVSTEKGFIGGTNVNVYRFTVSAASREDVAWKGIKFEVKGRLGGVDMATTTSVGSAAFGGGKYASSTPSSTLGLTTATSSAATKYARNFRLFETSTGQEVQNAAYLVHVDWNNSRNVGEVAFTMNDTKEERVSAGTSKTYDVRADISGVASNGDFLDVSQRQEANDRRGAADLVPGTDPDEVDGANDSMIVMTANSTGIVTPYSFLWSDNSGSPHSAADNDATVLERDWTNDRFVKFAGTSWNRSATGF